ncbi:hypothetical protein BKA81DRAFT_56679 [Phyllosticta paracitricarpa]
MPVTGSLPVFLSELFWGKTPESGEVGSVQGRVAVRRCPRGNGARGSAECLPRMLRACCGECPFSFSFRGVYVTARAYLELYPRKVRAPGFDLLRVGWISSQHAAESAVYYTIRAVSPRHRVVSASLGSFTPTHVEWLVIVCFDFGQTPGAGCLMVN